MPDGAQLSELERRAQSAVRTLVEEAGGRFETAAIPLGHIEVLAELFDDWARRNAQPSEHGLFFDGRPGLWHALDELYPLQDPNRWDRLRKEVIRDLESRYWRRLNPPRGSGFEITG